MISAITPVSGCTIASAGSSVSLSLAKASTALFRIGAFLRAGLRTNMSPAPSPAPSSNERCFSLLNSIIPVSSNAHVSCNRSHMHRPDQQEAVLPPIVRFGPRIQKILPCGCQRDVRHIGVLSYPLHTGFGLGASDHSPSRQGEEMLDHFVIFRSIFFVAPRSVESGFAGRNAAHQGELFIRQT